MDIKDITYLIPDNGSPIPNFIFLDYNSDLSIDQTANVTDNPIDAIRGASMQENRIVDMISVGISGAFSNRNSGRRPKITEGKILFSDSSNRLDTIVEWFEEAIENKMLFTVCKKGVLYKSQLLNSIKWTFDDSYSKIDVSLSFIEAVTAERAELEGSCSIIIPPKSPGVSKASKIYTVEKVD